MTERKRLKAAKRRKQLQYAKNIVHNNIPANMRSHFLPMSAEASRRTTPQFVPFSSDMRRKIDTIKTQRSEAMRKETPWYKRASDRVKQVFLGGKRLERRINHA